MIRVKQTKFGYEHDNIKSLASALAIQDGEYAESLIIEVASRGGRLNLWDFNLNPPRPIEIDQASYYRLNNDCLGWEIPAIQMYSRDIQKAIYRGTLKTLTQIPGVNFNSLPSRKTRRTLAERIKEIIEAIG